MREGVAIAIEIEIGGTGFHEDLSARGARAADRVEGLAARQMHEIHCRPGHASVGGDAGCRESLSLGRSRIREIVHLGLPLGEKPLRQIAD